MGLIVVVAEQDLSLADRVMPVIVGALIALVGAVIVQLWLIPRVETRKRREQRWEEDVLALGELLTFEQPRAVSEFTAHLHIQVFFATVPDDVDPTQWAVRQSEAQEKLRTARDQFDHVRARFDWLEDRVVSLAPESETLGHFSRLCRTYFLRHIQLGMLEWQREIDKVLTDEMINGAGDALQTATNGLVEELKKLARGNPPQRSPTRRVRQRLNRQLKRQPREK